MVAFAGRVEAKLTVPSGGAAASATNSGGGPTTCTVPAAPYYLTAVGGVSSLLTAFQTALNTSRSAYPSTAATTNTLIGDGAWTYGWHFNESSGNAAPAFGGLTLTAGGTPTYGIAGPGHSTDTAIGIPDADDYFDGGNVLGLTATDDLILGAIIKFPTTASTLIQLFSKGSGADADFWVVYALNNQITIRVTSGGVLRYDVSSADMSALVGEWCALLVIVDQTNGSVRVGLRGLVSAATAIGAASAQTAYIAGAANTFRIGDQVGHGASTAEFDLAALYAGKGAGIVGALGTDMATALQNFAAVNAQWAVTMSSTTGLVSISCSNGVVTPKAWSLSWTDTNLRDVLGFTANISNVTTTQTGAAQAKGLWFPDCSLTVEGDPERAPLVSDAVASVTPTGRVVTHVGNTFRRHRSLTWSHVPIAQVWDAEATYENGSWEEFFTETQLGLGSTWFTPGSPIQIYDHNGIQVGADASVAGWYIIGLNSIEPRKSVRDWTGLWRIEIPTLVAAGS